MSTRAPLAIGWQPGPFPTAALGAGIVLGAALAIHLAGLLAGLGVLGGAALLGALSWQEAWLDGPGIRLRSIRTGLRLRAAHARGIDRMAFQRSIGPARLRLRAGPEGATLVAIGPDPRADAFRQAAMWLIVHGQRQARLDGALVDALAEMPDHARTGQPHDASHA